MNKSIFEHNKNDPDYFKITSKHVLDHGGKCNNEEYIKSMPGRPIQGRHQGSAHNLVFTRTKYHKNATTYQKKKKKKKHILQQTKLENDSVL